MDDPHVDVGPFMQITTPFSSSRENAIYSIISCDLEVFLPIQFGIGRLRPKRITGEYRFSPMRSAPCLKLLATVKPCIFNLNHDGVIFVEVR